MIYLTGPIRGGTTWAGNMISLSSGIKQIPEILNPYNGQFYGTDWKYPFLFVSDKDKPLIDSIIGQSFNPKILTDRLKNVKGLGPKVKLILRQIAYLSYLDKNKFIKEPYGVFSAEWFFKTYNAKIIVISRHPAAFVTSMRRMKWGIRFSEILDQPCVNKALIEPFLTDEIKSNINRYDTSIEGLSVLWNIIHNRIHEYQIQYNNDPNWFFISHEELSEKPVENFEKIFRFLQIPFTELIRSAIKESTDTSNPREAKQNEMFTLKRNSKENITVWKSKLLPDEIKILRKITEDVSNKLGHGYSFD
jgi:hypothetical protein